MDKKYQVFVSSTYLDMKEERQAAVEAILEAGHIPAGMELFAASDKKQIEVIKKWIDRSDVFVLILGARYGSVERESGKSYIQLEYEHAIGSGKPYFALYLTNEYINKKVKLYGLDVFEQIETEKLKGFRDSVKSRMCAEIGEMKDIKVKIFSSLKQISEDHNVDGWIRTSDGPNYTALINKAAALQAENSSLTSRIKYLEEVIEVTKKNTINPASIFPWMPMNMSDPCLSYVLTFNLEITWQRQDNANSDKDFFAQELENWEISCRQLLDLLSRDLVICGASAPQIIKTHLENQEHFRRSDCLTTVEVDIQSLLSMYEYLEKLELLTIPSHGFDLLNYTLTPKGKNLLSSFIARKKFT